MSCCALEEPNLQGGLARGGLLLATDLDGTIAPIVDRPENARVAPLAMDVLRRCSRSAGVTVAVISGREIADVRSRLDGLRAIVAGSHGLECEDADGGTLWKPSEEFPAVDTALLRELDHAGILVEKKRFSMAAHFRQLDDAAPAGEALVAFAHWANEHRLPLVRGRRVLEARLAGWGKGAALEAIAAHVGAARTVYAGDDLTDVPALEFAAGNGRAIFVQSEERAAPLIDSLCIARSIEDLCCWFTCEIIDLGPAAVSSLLASPSVGT